MTMRVYFTFYSIYSMISMFYGVNFLKTLTQKIKRNQKSAQINERVTKCSQIQLQLCLFNTSHFFLSATLVNSKINQTTQDFELCYKLLFLKKRKKKENNKLKTFLSIQIKKNKLAFGLDWLKTLKKILSKLNNRIIEQF